MNRYIAGDSDAVFERLLGIEMKREQYRLSSLPELEEPRLWLTRIV